MLNRWARIVGLVWLATQGVVTVAAAESQGGGSSVSQPAASAAGDEAALAPFRAAVAGYVDLRKRISEELPPMKVTPHAAEINAASDALARAVQRGRGNARQGTFFTPEVGVVIRQRLELALRGADRAGVLALVNEEPPTIERPTIHMRFPAGAVLASSPAVLLHVLPPLPKELEYRFIGRILVLRDVEAALILDYLSPALPAS